MNAYIYVKQRKAMQDGQAVNFDIHKNSLGPDHLARQATEAEGKLQNSHYDGERNHMGLGQVCLLHKEQHTII